MKRVICLLSLFTLMSCQSNKVVYTVDETAFNNAIINKGKKYVQISEEAFLHGDGNIHALGNNLVSPKKFYSIFNKYHDGEETPSEFDEVYTEVIDDINCRYIVRDQFEPEFPSEWEKTTIEDARVEMTEFALPCDFGLKNLLALKDVDSITYSDFTYDEVNKEYHATYSTHSDAMRIEYYIQFENKLTKKIKLEETEDGDTDIWNYSFTYRATTPKDPRK